MERIKLVKRDKWYTLYGHLLSFRRLMDAFFKVKENNGAPGIDGVTVQEFGENLTENIEEIKQELQDKTYKPSPVKRVYIDKGNGEKRPLGIPTVKDRVVQQTLKMVMEPIYEEEFLDCSYGFRPDKSAHMAVEKVVDYLEEGNVWVVDADIKSYFDTIDHELLIDTVAEKISDSSILNLIRQFLTTGIIEEGRWIKTDEGTPQGGVISPLLANIYLHEFDKEMTERGHKLVRYADDWIILKKSLKSAQNIMEKAKLYLEQELKLRVHPEKTKLVDARQESFQFLGFYFKLIDDKNTPENHELKAIFGPSQKSLKKFKSKVREITRRNQTTSAEVVISELNKILTGWGNYFGIGYVKWLFENLDGWMRRRIRMVQMRSWRTPNKLLAILKKKGIKGNFKRISMTSWKNSACQMAHLAMDLEWFAQRGWYGLADVRNKLLSEKG